MSHSPLQGWISLLTSTVRQRGAAQTFLYPFWLELHPVQLSPFLPFLEPCSSSIMAETKLGKFTLAALGKAAESDQSNSAVGGSSNDSVAVGGNQKSSGVVDATDSNAKPSDGDARVDRQQGLKALSSLLARNESELDEEIDRLRSQRESMQKEKKRVSRDLRNTERKKSRLRTKAKLLSSTDLLEVYAMRMRMNEKAAEKAAASKTPVAAPENVSK